VTGDWSRRRFLGAFAAGGGAELLATSRACSQTSNGILERLRREKIAKVALAAQPPFSEMLPDGALNGLGPTVAQAVMDRLGVPKLEGIVVPYGEIIPGLMAGRWDFVAACLSITQARCKQDIHFSPICFDPVVIAYLNDRENLPTSISEIGKQGLKVGLISGAYMLPMTRKLASPDKVTVFPDAAALIDGLSGRRVDVALATSAGFILLQQRRSAPFKISQPMTDVKPAGSGPAFRSDDLDLIDAFERELKAMKVSGEIARVNEQFGFRYSRSLYDDISMKEACLVAI
jgi:polar amino acid transport system substrate-binding protein